MFHYNDLPGANGDFRTRKVLLDLLTQVKKITEAQTHQSFTSVMWIVPAYFGGGERTLLLKLLEVEFHLKMAQLISPSDAYFAQLAANITKPAVFVIAIQLTTHTEICAVKLYPKNSEKPEIIDKFSEPELGETAIKLKLARAILMAENPDDNLVENEIPAEDLTFYDDFVDQILVDHKNGEVSDLKIDYGPSVFL